MFKRRDTKLIVENWRSFINEDNNMKPQPVKICQALANPEGIKTLASMGFGNGAQRLEDMDTFKKLTRIFQVSKSLLNMLIVGPLPVTFKDPTNNLEDIKYAIVIFKEGFDESNVFESPKKIANEIAARGVYDANFQEDITIPVMNKENVDILIVSDYSYGTAAGDHRVEFCTNALSGSTSSYSGIKFFRPGNNLGAVVAHDDRDKSFKNASVFTNS